VHLQISQVSQLITLVSELQHRHCNYPNASFWFANAQQLLLSWLAMSVAMILEGSAAIASKDAAALPVDEGSAAAASNKENADVNTTTT